MSVMTDFIEQSRPLSGLRRICIDSNHAGGYCLNLWTLPLDRTRNGEPYRGPDVPDAESARSLLRAAGLTSHDGWTWCESAH